MKSAIHLLSIACFLFIMSCQQEKKQDPVTVAVNYTNAEGTEVTVAGMGYKKSIDLVEGRATGSFDITRPGYYRVSTDGASSLVYMSPGDEISLTGDVKSYAESVILKTPHDAVQSYLKSKAKIKEQLLGRDLFSLDEESFTARLQEKRDSIKSYLTLSTEYTDVILNEKQGMDFEDAQLRALYPLYLGVDKDSLSEAFHNPMKGMDMADEDMYLKSEEYRDLVSSNFDLQMNTDTTGTYEEIFMRKIQSLPTGNIKNQLLYGTFRYLMGPNEKMEDMYAFFNAESTDADHKEQVTETYQELQKLKRGELSPKFDYENFAGGQTALDDLKGKYVYVDVWATWCGPCKAEIPSLKKLEKEYHGKNIEFVSISVDSKRDHGKWGDMIKDKDLGGVQLFADDSWQSKFVQDYRINGIPRFILIDPEGKIVSADAPRPSDEKLVEKLKELSI